MRKREHFIGLWLGDTEYRHLLKQCALSGLNSSALLRHSIMSVHMFEYLAEPMSNCFSCMKLNSLEDAKAEMNRRIRETEYYFAIVIRDTGKVIGEIDAYPEHAEPHDQDGNSPLDTFSPCWKRSTFQAFSNKLRIVNATPFSKWHIDTCFHNVVCHPGY